MIHTLQAKSTILACFCGKSFPLSPHSKNRNLGGFSIGFGEISVNFCRTLSARSRKNVNWTRPIELYEICNEKKTKKLHNSTSNLF